LLKRYISVIDDEVEEHQRREVRPQYHRQNGNEMTNHPEFDVNALAQELFEDGHHVQSMSEEHTSSQNIDFNDHSVNSTENFSEDDNVFRERKE